MQQTTMPSGETGSTPGERFRALAPSAGNPGCSSEEARQRCVRGMQLMVNGTLSEFEAVVHPRARNFEADAEPPAARQSGPLGFYATALWLRAAFADLAFDIHEVVCDGDLVVVHNTMRGRQHGTMVAYDAAGEVEAAFPSKGRPFATTQTHWMRLADGLIIEHWANRDDLGTAKQLGWVPPTPLYLVRMARALRRARRAGA